MWLSRSDYVPLANLIGVIFQIRDDYMNLQSTQVRSRLRSRVEDADLRMQYADNKGYCEDLSEGKFSFPVVHSIRADTSNQRLLSASSSSSPRWP